MGIIAAIFTVSRAVWGFSLNFILSKSDDLLSIHSNGNNLSLIQNHLHFKQAVFGLRPNELSSTCVCAEEERT